MKHIILVVGILALSSCARTYIRQWGGGQVTACGNKHTNDETIQRAAEEKCGGSATALGGGIVESGVQLHRNYFTDNAVTGASVTHDQCIVYKCGEPGPAPASVK